MQAICTLAGLLRDMRGRNEGGGGTQGGGAGAGEGGAVCTQGSLKSSDRDRIK